MEKKPFLTLQQAQEISKTYPTPFHIYDEKAIRENARKVKAALERHIRLPLLHFCLLQAQHIRLLLRDKLQKALAHARAQAVYIP